MNELYGTFLDACEGFRQVHQYMIELEENSKQTYGDLKETWPELAHFPLDDAEFSYGRAVPAGSPPRYRCRRSVLRANVPAVEGTRQ